MKFRGRCTTNFADEVYYYEDTEALFADPKSVDVRKLGVVASISCQILESTRDEQGHMRDRGEGGGEEDCSHGEGGGGGGGRGDDRRYDCGGNGERDGDGDGEERGTASSLPGKRRVIECSFYIVSPRAGVQQV